MKRFLPLIVISCLLLVISSFLFVQRSFAAPISVGEVIPPNTWVEDSEVTFVGKMASRSGNFINWTLKNHDWIDTQGNPNPLGPFWRTILGIVAGFFGLFVLVTAFLIVITRGRNITLMQFLPRFITVVLLIFFSFALVSNLYTITDIVQGFFLKNPDYNSAAPAPNVSEKISSANLLHIGFNYQDFKGYRFTGPANDESAFVSLLLVRLTALTYYVMGGLLLLRKIILWFFLVISPVFPLLLLYAPLRNTAKIWLGEFMRWLLYAPIFAIFLSGLVTLWRTELVAQFSIPLHFSPQVAPSPIEVTNGIISPGYIYPTAINILLGGPGQQVALGNSLNYTDTFVQYIIALIMIWVVILLPFLLLQIFLDYLHSVAISESTIVKQLMNASSSVFPKPPAPSPAIVPPTPSEGAGLGRQLPFANKVSIPTSIAKSLPVSQVRSQDVDRDILHMTNLSVPTIRDIARFETTNLRSEKNTETTRITETLTKIANPTQATSSLERERFNLLKERLVREQQNGNPLANSILSAATLSSQNVTFPLVQELLKKLANPASVSSPYERQKVTAMRNELLHKRQEGNPLASSLLSSADAVAQNPRDQTSAQKVHGQLLDAQQKSDPVAKNVINAMSGSVPAQLPAVNRVQSVSLDDYEAVKKMWTENYQKLEPPQKIGDTQKDRASWVQDDMSLISQTISLLSSSDPQKVKEGMEKVSHILPFLLIGGFSQTEVIAYLKAKLEAAKFVKEELKKKDDEEGTLVEVNRKKEEEVQHMMAQEHATVDEMNQKINEINTESSLGNPTDEHS